MCEEIAIPENQSRICEKLMSKKDKQLLVFSAEDHVLVKRRKADTFIPLTEYLNASSFTEN